MQAAAPATMTPDIGPRGAAVTVSFISQPRFPQRSASSPKVTFHSLEIFCRRYQLRCNARTRHHTRLARIF